MAEGHGPTQFEHQEGLIKDFATFCKRLESLLEDTESRPHKKQALLAKKTTRNRAATIVLTVKSNDVVTMEKATKKNHFCLLHGKIACTTPTSAVRSNRMQNKQRRGQEKWRQEPVQEQSRDPHYFRVHQAGKGVG